MKRHQDLRPLRLLCTSSLVKYLVSLLCCSTWLSDWSWKIQHFKLRVNLPDFVISKIQNIHYPLNRNRYKAAYRRWLKDLSLVHNFGAGRKSASAASKEILTFEVFAIAKSGNTGLANNDRFGRLTHLEAILDDRHGWIYQESHSRHTDVILEVVTDAEIPQNGDAQSAEVLPRSQAG